MLKPHRDGVASQRDMIDRDIHSVSPGRRVLLETLLSGCFSCGQTSDVESDLASVMGDDPNAEINRAIAWMIIIHYFLLPSLKASD